MQCFEQLFCNKVINVTIDDDVDKQQLQNSSSSCTIFKYFPFELKSSNVLLQKIKLIDCYYYKFRISMSFNLQTF